MRCGCILVAAAILLIMLGIQGIHEAHAYSKPVEITSQQFMAAAPQEGWYKIKGCELEIDEAVYMVTTYKSSSTPDTFHPRDDSSDTSGDPEKAANPDKTSGSDKTPSAVKDTPPSKHKHPGDAADKSKADAKSKTAAGDDTTTTDAQTDSSSPDDDKDITKVYIPVHCPDTFDEKTDHYPSTNLVIQTEDKEILETANAMKRLGKQKPAEIKKWLADNKEKLVVHKDILGMVQNGFSSDKETRTEISKLQESLTPNYLIVEEGKQPSMSGGVGMLMGGVALAVLSVLYWAGYLLRWKQRLT